MQTVRDVLKELSRFSLDARIEDEVVIHGVSPAIACQIDTVGGKITNEKLSELEIENEDLDARATEIIKALKKTKELLESQKIKEALEIIAKVL